MNRKRNPYRMVERISKALLLTVLIVVAVLLVVVVPILLAVQGMGWKAFLIPIGSATIVAAISALGIGIAVLNRVWDQRKRQWDRTKEQELRTSHEDWCHIDLACYHCTC